MTLLSYWRRNFRITQLSQLQRWESFKRIKIIHTKYYQHWKEIVQKIYLGRYKKAVFWHISFHVLKSERNKLWYKPWFNFNLVLPMIRSLFRVLGMYNFEKNKKDRKIEVLMVFKTLYLFLHFVWFISNEVWLGFLHTNLTLFYLNLFSFCF